jgi:hypothetical protein
LATRRKEETVYDQLSSSPPTVVEVTGAMNPAIAVHVHVTCEPGAREKVRLAAPSIQYFVSFEPSADLGQLFEHYRPLVAAAQTNPGLIIYYVGTPVNDETETDVIVFEMYATQP